MDYSICICDSCLFDYAELTLMKHSCTKINSGCICLDFQMLALQTPSWGRPKLIAQMTEPGFGTVTLLWSTPAHFCSLLYSSVLMWTRGFPCSSVGKESACNAGDLGSIPGSGRSPGEGNGNPLQYSCLENPMDRGAWKAMVHRVTKVGHDLVLSFFLSTPNDPHLLVLVPCVIPSL